MNNHQYLKNGNASPQGETQSRLISLLNAAGSALEGTRPFAPIHSQTNANYTDADVKFLEAAREVVSLHQYQIDPTIRDILNRLQYANSPHGGLPFSREYLDKLNEDEDGDDEEEAEQADQATTPSNGDQRFLGDDAYLHGAHGGHNTGNDEFPQLSLDIFKTDDIFHNNSSSDNTSAARTTLLGAGIAGLSSAVANNSRSFSHNKENHHSPSSHVVNAPEDIESPSTFFHNQVSQYEREQRDSIYASEPPINAKSKISVDGVPRNYLCKTCGLSFKRSSDLKRHEKIHLEVPPNVCPNCKKGFARKDALKRHINTLTCKRNRERLLKSMKNNT